MGLALFCRRGCCEHHPFTHLPIRTRPPLVVELLAANRKEDTMQWKRLAAITLSAVLVAVPAYSIPVVDPAALAQRITMMVNQVSIITNQLTQDPAILRPAHGNDGPGEPPEGKGPGSLPRPHFALHQPDLHKDRADWGRHGLGQRVSGYGPASSPTPTRSCPMACLFEGDGTACSRQPTPSLKTTCSIFSRAFLPTWVPERPRTIVHSGRPPTAGGCSTTPWPMRRPA